jgi:hypothetical protein
MYMFLLLSMTTLSHRRSIRPRLGGPGLDQRRILVHDTINYLIAWLGCAKTDGLTINYLGGWNERGYNISWYEQLRTALNSADYGSVQIVGADHLAPGWG